MSNSLCFKVDSVDENGRAVISVYEGESDPILRLTTTTGSGSSTSDVDLSCLADMIDEKTVPIYQGATASATGVTGTVPPATSAQKDSFLKGDGTWVDLSSFEDSIQSIEGEFSCKTNWYVSAYSNNTYSEDTNNNRFSSYVEPALAADGLVIPASLSTDDLVWDGIFGTPQFVFSTIPLSNTICRVKATGYAKSFNLWRVFDAAYLYADPRDIKLYVGSTTTDVLRALSEGVETKISLTGGMLGLTSQGRPWADSYETCNDYCRYCDPALSLRSAGSGPAQVLPFDVYLTKTIVDGNMTYQARFEKNQAFDFSAVPPLSVAPSLTLTTEKIDGTVDTQEIDLSCIMESVDDKIASIPVPDAITNAAIDTIMAQ